MKVCTIPCYDRGYFYVVLVLQSCSDTLHILPGSSIDANATSDCAHHVGNMKFEGDLDMQVEEELKVKTEKGVGSEEEECIDIKDEQGLNTEEEVKEEDVDIKDEEDVDIKEEVSLDGTV